MLLNLINLVVIKGEVVLHPADFLFFIFSKTKVIVVGDGFY